MTKSSYKLQFEADHNDASKDAIIAIDDLKFTEDCKRYSPPKPSKKPSKPSTPTTVAPEGKKSLLSESLWVK